MNTGPGPLVPTAGAGRLVRLWDTDWQLCHILNPGDVIPAGKGLGFTYPLDHVVSRWIMALRPGPRIYMTVDVRDGRSTLRLDSWEIRRAGDCPFCPHCQQQVMDTRWLNMDHEYEEIDRLYGSP